MPSDLKLRAPSTSGLASLEQWAYTQIKEAIISLALPPGAPLVEAHLAEQLGLSKTPLRAALLRLEREGFVIGIPYKGSSVAPISLEVLAQLRQLRIATEGHAIYSAALSFGSGDIAAVEALLAAQEQAEAVGDLAEAARLEDGFDDLFLERLGNPRFVEIAAELRDHRRRLRFAMEGLNPGLSSFRASHRAILDAVRRRDACGAYQTFIDIMTAYGTFVERMAREGKMRHVGVEPEVG
ncbi:MAG: GntR family transcriptional regulator [Chloroflexota bacterium]